MRYALGKQTDIPVAERASIFLGMLGHLVLPFPAGFLCASLWVVWYINRDPDSARPQVPQELLIASTALFGVTILIFWLFRRFGARALRREQDWHATLPFTVAGYTFAIARGQNIFLTWIKNRDEAQHALQGKLEEQRLKGTPIYEVDGEQLRLRLEGTPRQKVKRLRKLIIRVLLPLQKKYPLKSIEF